MTPTVRRASLARSPPDPPGRGRSRGSPSPPSSPNRRTRRAPRRPAQIQTVVPAGRKVDRERSAGAPGDCPGGLQTSLEKNVLFKGGLQPPLPGGGRRRCSGPGARRVAASLLGRRDHEAPRPQGGTRRAVTEAGCSTGSSNNPGCRGMPSSTDTGDLVDQTALDPGGGSARPQSSAPGGRARVSRASSRPRRGPRDRPRSPPAGRGARRPRAPRPGPRSGRRCPALARAREGDSCYDARRDRLPRLERISGRAAILGSPRRSANRRPITTCGKPGGGGSVDGSASLISGRSSLAGCHP